MKIDHGWISDLRPTERPILHLVLEDTPQEADQLIHKQVNNQTWVASPLKGHINEFGVTLQGNDDFDPKKYLGVSPAAHFNSIFPELGPQVDLKLSVFEDGTALPLSDQFFVLKLAKARSIVRKLTNREWSYYMSDFDGQRGLLAWELIERNPKCKFHALYGGSDHTTPTPGAARVTVSGIQYPLCSHHLHEHNGIQAARRRTVSK